MTGGNRYVKLESNNSWTSYYTKLRSSVKFIIFLCLLITIGLCFYLIWGKSGDSSSHSHLEKLARERHAGMKLNKISNDQISQNIKPKSLRTLAPDQKLAISQCPHPREPSATLINSVKLLDHDPVCKKALFAGACQLEKGLLYDATLPVTCPKESNKPDAVTGTPKILFVIDVNSGSARQVERLLINIYRNTHYYLFLIPNCFSAAAERLKKLQNLTSNLRFLFYDIECPDDAVADVSLPQTPETWRIVIENATGWNWNYLLTLDSFDFPILNIDKLTLFLENHSGTNFLESYNLDVESDYIRNITSSACGDGRRWAIGQGRPPSNLVYFQGPPWYLLTRQFLDYALFSDQDRLVEGLKKFATMTLYPAQLLFHTLAHNGRYCHTFVNESLRLTKFHIFDQRSRDIGYTKMKPQEQEQLSSWTFSSKDFVYLHESNAFYHRDPTTNMVKGEKFWARRFDPTIHQQIIYDLESTLNEKPYFPLETLRLHSYWQTLWTNRMDDRRKSTLRYAAVARLLSDLCLKRLKRCTNLMTTSSTNARINELTLFRDYDMNDGLILSMNISCGNDPNAKPDIPLECFVNFQHNEKIKSGLLDITDLRNDLLHMRVGSDYDLMDNIFRNYAGSVILDTNEIFGLRTNWVPGELGAQYQFAWLDPKEYVAGTTLAAVGPWTTTHFQPKSDDLQRLQSGIWTSAILSDAKVVGATEFLVLPESQSVYETIDIKDRLKWAKKFYEINRLCVPILVSKKLTKQCQCGPPIVPSCETTAWSTLAPDSKSNFALFMKRQKDELNESLTN